jgi:hypothetical protein
MHNGPWTNKWIPIQCFDFGWSFLLMHKLDTCHVQQVHKSCWVCNGANHGDYGGWMNFQYFDFYEDKLYNKLCEHLDLVIHMYAQPFYTINFFPYQLWCNHGLDYKQTKEGMLFWSAMYY